jgi:hypothetical protein
LIDRQNQVLHSADNLSPLVGRYAADHARAGRGSESPRR